MKNFVHFGESIPITAPSGGVSAGDPLVVGAFFGVVIGDAAEGDPTEIALTGAYDLPKHSGDVVALGDALYWNGSNITTSSGSDAVLIGAAGKAAGGSDATVRTRLNGISI